MVHRVVVLSDAKVRVLWADASATRYTLPALAGCSYDTLRRRARALGLGPRKTGGRLRFNRRLVRLMWLAGVSSYEIASAVECGQSSIIRAAQAMALPPRGPGFLVRLSLTEFCEVRLRIEMAGSAQQGAAKTLSNTKSWQNHLRVAA